MTPKVSIIVPIYNAGKFLEKCLDTLVNQTLKDIEIILVLDCPTDGSDRIAREYAEKDPRIRLIVNEQNLNIGLRDRKSAMKDLKSPGENTSVFRTTMTGGNWICTKNYTKRPGKIRPILPSPISTAFIRIGSFLIHITLTVLTKNN